MIMRFTDKKTFLNICFQYKNYNFEIEDAEYIVVSTDALELIREELDANGFDISENLKANKYQKLAEEQRKEAVSEITERINNGEFLTVRHVIGRNGKRYPCNPKLQRDVIYATMLAYPQCNNSEIARMTGSSRGTVIKCRKYAVNYKDIVNCSDASNDTSEHVD